MEILNFEQNHLLSDRVADSAVIFILRILNQLGAFLTTVICIIILNKILYNYLST
jgi:hypothetical protein